MRSKRLHNRIIQGAAYNSIVKGVLLQITNHIMLKALSQARWKCKDQRPSRCIIPKNIIKTKLHINIINLINNISSKAIETTDIIILFRYLAKINKTYKIQWFRKVTWCIYQDNRKAQINQTDKTWEIYNIFYKAQVNWAITDQMAQHQLD